MADNYDVHWLHSGRASEARDLLNGLLEDGAVALEQKEGLELLAVKHERVPVLIVGLVQVNRVTSHIKIVFSQNLIQGSKRKGADFPTDPHLVERDFSFAVPLGLHLLSFNHLPSKLVALKHVNLMWKGKKICKNNTDCHWQQLVSIDHLNILTPWKTLLIIQLNTGMVKIKKVKLSCE